MIKLLLFFLLVIIAVWIWTSIAKSARLILCPHCRKQVDKAAHVCPYCRREIKRADAPPPLACAECGRTLQDESRPCPSCGSNWQKHVDET